MIDHRIDIVIKNLESKYFEGMLIDFFRRNRTPIFPIYIRHDTARKVVNKEEVENDVVITYESTYRNFQVVKASKNENTWFIPLAKIDMQEQPGKLVVFIEGIKEKKKDWKKVEDIAKEIIYQLKLLNHEIESIKPTDLLPEILTSNGEVNAKKPQKPSKPAMKSGLDKWFEYYDECQKRRYKFTLKELAQESGYSHGYIRGEYPLYKRQQDYKVPDKKT